MIIPDKDGEYFIGCQPYNQNITPGASVTFGFLVEPGTSDAEVRDIVVTEYVAGDGSEDDGLMDGDEIILGTEPKDGDSDDDGILDGYEIFEQSYTYVVEDEACAIDEITVSLEGAGCLENNTTIESVMGKDYHSSRVVGLFGEPFEIETEVEFESATLTFKVDKECLGDIPFENLMFLWYDEENYLFVELETTLDEVSGTASINTTHFSKYMLVDKQKWYDAQYNQISCQRIDAAMEYINGMSEDDQTAIIFYKDAPFIHSYFPNDAFKVYVRPSKLKTEIEDRYVNKKDSDISIKEIWGIN